MPTEPMQFPSWPHYDQDEIDAVTRVLRSGQVNAWTGPDVELFEQDYAAYCGVKHAIAMANGTLALEAALIGLQLQPGDEVIVTSRTFIASASAIVLRGGVPVFCDVDRDSQNMDPASVAELIGPRTVGMVAVHLAGWPCDMDALGELAKRHGLWIVEDCAQAHGAQWKGRPVGSFGDAAAFSFCQDKIISTGGEGGMLVTNDENVYHRAWSFKDHGKDPVLVGQARQSTSVGCQWVHATVGSNWRLTGPQAAMGRIQLGKLDQWQAQRQRNAQVLIDGLARFSGVRIPVPENFIRHAYYKFYVFVPATIRDALVRACWDHKLPVGAGACSEIYREGAFADRAMSPAQRLPVARELGGTSLMLPVHPTLQELHMRYLVDRLAELVAGIS